MTLDEFRRKMCAYRHAADQDAVALKNSNLAWQWLHSLYSGLSDDERILADQVIAEWVLSDEENLRYDALVLVDDFSIANALPAVKTLEERLGRSSSPSARYELRKVEEILKKLS